MLLTAAICFEGFNLYDVISRLYLVSDYYGCSNESIQNLISLQDLEIKDKKIVEYRIGEEIELTCQNTKKTLSRDIWDQNSTDNILHLRCGSNEKFDAPKQMPICLAKCRVTTFPTKFFSVPGGHDPFNNTDEITEIYEGEKIWYLGKLDILSFQDS